MMRSIIDIINEEIMEWNSLERKIPVDNYELFKFEDFDYILHYSEKYGNEFDTIKFIDFCSLKLLEELSSSTQRKSIWYWEGINDSFLIPQLKYLSRLIETYIDLKDREEYKLAFIVFRSYIEISSQLYACFLDLEFYTKYKSDNIQEDYTKHWFKHLKPEKVLSVLRRLNQDVKIESKKTGRYTLGDLRGFIYPFESEQRKTLYNYLTSFAHGKYEAINNDLDIDELNEIRWRVTEYIVSSINLIQIASDHYLTKGQYDSRKHIILQQIWYSIKYKN